MSGTNASTNSGEALWTSQTIIALALVAIVAGTVAAVLWNGDPQVKSQTVGGVLALGALVGGFYFGSSSGSQRKDATIASQAAADAAVVPAVVAAVPAVVPAVPVPAAAPVVAPVTSPHTA